jgi:molybdenum cofactor synthesis domain-containing protein
MRNTTAAILVIGNEILSGKVQDTNAAFLAVELRHLGVDLRRILVVPDEIDVIADAVREYRRSFDLVFTSGGVGPTHDDLTVAGIAAGLGRRVVRDPVLEEKIREFTHGKADAAQLKMAEVPEGAELVWAGDVHFPILQVENMYIMPGIPEIFRAKFLAMKSRFAVDPFFLRVLYTSAAENVIAVYLDDTQRAFPLLQLGSYPKLGHPEYRVRITLESKDRDYVEQALDFLLGRLPPRLVVRTE